jgi:hypothetical protein
VSVPNGKKGFGKMSDVKKKENTRIVVFPWVLSLMVEVIFLL